mgnify:CR=1 FL=1
MNRSAMLVLGGLFFMLCAMPLKASEMDKGSGSEKLVEQDAVKKADSSEWGVAVSARASIKGTQPDSQIDGVVDFVETGDGVQVVASVAYVPNPGKHGFHIHENGSCEDGGKAAGGHFNADGTKHGFLLADGHGKAHTGDMGNIKIDQNGNGTLVIFMPGLSLAKGHRNIAGKAVILHEGEDDFGQPTGNAGSRIGCGEIILNK